MLVTEIMIFCGKGAENELCQSSDVISLFLSCSPFPLSKNS